METVLTHASCHLRACKHTTPLSGATRAETECVCTPVHGRWLASASASHSAPNDDRRCLGDETADALLPNHTKQGG